MAKKKFIPVPVLSREALDSTVARVATLKLEHAAAKTAMELEIAAVQEKHQSKMLGISQELEQTEASVFVYCQQHRKELFPDKKSIDFLLATVGFRTEPHSVEKRTKADKWEAIAARLETLPWGAEFLTDPKPDVNKKALLAARERLTAEQLAEAGIRFEQDEVFYITPKSEVTDKTALLVA